MPPVPDAEETGTRRLKTEHRTIAGRSAGVRHWLFEEGDSRGVTIILNDVVPGKRVQVSGWATAREWKKRAKVDAKATTGFAVAIGTEKRADMWPTNRVWISLVRRPDDRFVLGLNRSGDQTWSLPLAPDFMVDTWNGTLQVSLGRQWISVALPGGPLLRAPIGFDGGTPLYATIVSHPAREHEAAKLALERVTAQWLTPARMSAADRWSLLDSAEFDASGFLSDLASELPTSAGTQAGDSAEGDAIGAEDAPLFLDAPAVQPTAPADVPRPSATSSAPCATPGPRR